MKQALQLRLSQHLTLTPQLQQSIRLLQLSTTELNQELERFLAENPMLEREDANEPAPALPVNGASPRESGEGGEAAAPEFGSERADDGPAAGSDTEWLSSSGNYSGGERGDDDGDDYPQTAADSPSLREHLLSQLVLLKLDQRDRAIAAMVVESLDDDGYLTQSLEELADMVPAELEVEPEELSIALCHVQNLDPIGVAARNPAECLALQLEALDPATPHRATALRIAREHLPLLAARDFAKLKRLVGASDDQLRGAQQLIQRMNPRPGAAFSHTETRYVVPDVVVKKTKNLWVASLNPDAMPKLHVNRMYAAILQGNRGAASGQLSQQLQEARWLIKNVQQRFETILKVSQAIVDRQRHFFEHGEVAMRPLVLREIAETLGLHESTISRVTTQKFMLTPRGIFELKYFFGSHVATDTGGACSATAIRALIKQLVAAEDGKHPLSDSRISEVLSDQGIVVARRTIAKYREALQIPPVNQRKAL
ncbi:MAG TPA: RNA polymerase factor sigma-54 [Burkholderiales bacterium]|nr:RNA polymerase factor sigma-54 [Burkholderiales bacterium]